MGTPDSSPTPEATLERGAPRGLENRQWTVVGLQAALEALALQVEAYLDMPRLEAIIWGD
jgi:hypothetical protein